MTRPETDWEVCRALLDCSLQVPVPTKGVFSLNEEGRKKTQLNVSFAVEVRRETRQDVRVMDLERK